MASQCPPHDSSRSLLKNESINPLQELTRKRDKLSGAPPTSLLQQAHLRSSGGMSKCRPKRRGMRNNAAGGKHATSLQCLLM